MPVNNDYRQRLVTCAAVLALMLLVLVLTACQTQPTREPDLLDRALDARWEFRGTKDGNCVRVAEWIYGQTPVGEIYRGDLREPTAQYTGHQFFCVDPQHCVDNGYIAFGIFTLRDVDRWLINVEQLP